VGYEMSMKDTDRSEPKRSDVVVPQVFVVMGCRWFLFVAMTTGFPLITQRSLVQIQPPQPHRDQEPVAEHVRRPQEPSEPIISVQ